MPHDPYADNLHLKIAGLLSDNTELIDALDRLVEASGPFYRECCCQSDSDSLEKALGIARDLLTKHKS